MRNEGEIATEIILNEEVKDFYLEGDWYYVILRSGRCLNIVRSQSVQPAIDDPLDYPSYLWVEAKEGFFLFRQRFLMGRGGPWVVEKQIVPADPADFFRLYLDRLRQNLEGRRLLREMTDHP